MHGLVHGHRGGKRQQAGRPRPNSRPGSTLDIRSRGSSPLFPHPNPLLSSLQSCWFGDLSTSVRIKSRPGWKCSPLLLLRPSSGPRAYRATRLPTSSAPSRHRPSSGSASPTVRALGPAHRRPASSNSRSEPKPESPFSSKSEGRLLRNK